MRQEDLLRNLVFLYAIAYTAFFQQQKLYLSSVEKNLRLPADKENQHIIAIFFVKAFLKNSINARMRAAG